MSSALICRKFALIILVVPLFTMSFAQGLLMGPTSAGTDQNKDEKVALKARNLTPTQIWEEVEWMKRVRVSGVSGISPEDEIYFIQYTEPAPGSLHFRDGRISTGNLQLYKRYNKTENDVEWKFIMIIDGKRKVYTGWDVVYYYYSFTPSELKEKVWRMGTKVSLTASSFYEDYKSQNVKYPAEVFARGTLKFMLVRIDT